MGYLNTALQAPAPLSMLAESLTYFVLCVPISCVLESRDTGKKIVDKVGGGGIVLLDASASKCLLGCT